MAKANTSSIDTTDGDKMAFYANAKFKPANSKMQTKQEDVVDQVVNGKKAANLATYKAKAKRKSKMAKASRKKNKK